ncbi:zinc ribbon domain-containing protein [Actinomycetospora lutea]|uniref:FmdB family zinc ribbon protein n=1 Tax=Actinomycetospora lutea TaxID=663604 RepID=UPI002365D8F4|nr:zinc ribbon domain-containing protein [Actinomycetospora lutea]MDD7939465.1 zinc ribbon domain-containing protein [Actinomycetospora lutea]
MPLYAYRCDEDGPVEVMRPMGAAPPTVSCPACGADATRVITAPRLRGDGARIAAIDRAEASRTEPTVVSAPPPRAVGPRPAPRLDPRTAALPRP